MNGTMQYPMQDDGFYHLTPSGWIRRDEAPFPENRVETWSYRMECLSDDAKESVCLRRVWKDKHLAVPDRKTLHGRFGLPVELHSGRNITLECDV